MFRKTLIILAMLFAILGSGAEAWGQTYEKVMELDMTTKAAKCGSYNTTTPYGDWKITNGANNNGGWAYFKMGGKSATISTYNPCYIYYSANSGVSSKVDKITVSIADGSLSKSGMSVNSWGVYVYSDKAMTTQIDYVAGGTITKDGATFDFTPSAGKTWAAGSYYKVSWDLANTSSTNGIVCVDKITLYKESTPSHTLTFSATNGSITALGEDEAEIESSDNVEEGATLDITATADDWYKFSGWSVTGTGSSVESTTTNPTTFTMGTADATLTATFAACVVTVSSNDENWGIALYDDESHTISTAAEDGYRISSTEPYTIAPADAATLTAGDDDTFVVSGVKDQDVEITINFEALPSVAYTVYFDGNNHGTPASESIKEASAGAGITLPGCTPEAGYQFVGWATSETATEAEYEAGATYYPTEDITLYAVYNSVYTINYMVNGINTGAQVNVEEGTPLVFPTVTAPDADHVFRGWVTEAIEGTTDTEPAYVNTTDLTATQSITYYAVFAEKEGGEESESLACPKGTISNNTMTFNTTNFVIVHAKGTSSNFAEYSPWRIYKNNTVTVSSNSKTISKLEMVTSEAYYGTWTTTAGTVNVATTSGGTTSVTGINAKEVTLENTGSAARWSNITIYYDETSYSNFCTTIVTKTLTSIELSGEYPTEFWKGDAFSHEGMTVTAHYSNAPDADVTSKATFSTPDMTTVGEQTVTVTYDTKSTTYNITVKTIANTPENAYTVAEAKSLIDANPAELATTNVYVKGTVSKIVTEWSSQYGNITFDVSADGQTTGDQFQFYRNFRGANKTRWVSAAECPAVGDDVIGLGKLTKYGSTYEFTEGNYIVSLIRAATLSINDITVSLGEEISPEITTNVPEDERTITYSVASEDVVKVQGGNLVTVKVGGPVEVTATLTADSYKETTTTFEVTVIKALQSIIVKTAPTKLEYKEGDLFNPAGLVITATYSDATTEDVPYEGNEDSFTFEPSLETELTTEDNSVTITYAGKEATQEISVHPLDTYNIIWMANGIAVTLEPATVVEGNVIGTLPTPEAEYIPTGFDFAGWSSSESSTATIGETYIVNADVTLYAVFSRIEGGSGETTWNLVTNSSEIVAGKVIKIAATVSGSSTTTYNGTFAANGTISNSIMGKVSATISDNKLTNDEGAAEFTIGGTSGNWTLAYDVKLLGATAVKNLAYDDGTTTWGISIDGNAKASIANGTTSYGTILYNRDSPRFTTYTSTPSASMVLPQIFVKTVSGTTHYYTRVFTEESEIDNLTVEAPMIIMGGYTLTVTNDLEIANNAAFTIEENAKVVVNGTLTNLNADNLIIKDGGQLVFNNSGNGKDGNSVKATVEKNIIPYGSSKGDKGWHFLAAPMTDFAVASFIEQAGEGEGHGYDLYRWYIKDNGDPIWYNYKAHHEEAYNEEVGTGFEPKFLSGRGYLAAYETTDLLRMQGTLNAGTTFDFTVNSKDNFTLLGNPFTYDLNWSDFTMNHVYNGFAVVNNLTGIIEYVAGDVKTIKVGTGFMVYTEKEGATLSFNKNSESGKSNDILALNLFASNGNGEDNTIIVIDDNNGGFAKADNFNTNVPQIYTERLQTKYGIRNFSTNTKEFFVSFKAVGEGSNTIRLETIGEFDYVHLYDKLLDVDVDMLLEGSYTFEASEGDDTHRFIVRIDKGNTGIDENESESENFVSVYNGEIHVSGSGKVQIFDVMGRMVHSEVINGDATISTSNIKGGVYVVRLIGDGWTKTEKIVVRR